MICQNWRNCVEEYASIVVSPQKYFDLKTLMAKTPLGHTSKSPALFNCLMDAG